MLLSTIYAELLLPIPTDCHELDVSKCASAALIYASKRRDLPIIERLLLIPSVRKIVSEDSKMLELAASMGDLVLIKRLLLIPAILENVTANRSGALREAARNGHLDVVEYLLTIPAVLNGYKKRGTGSLLSACENGHLPVVECLLSVGCVIGDDAYIYWSAASARGHLDVVEYLLTIPAVLEHVTADAGRALRGAACNGHFNVVKHLLTIPVVLENAAANIEEALRGAACSGHLDVVKLLLTIPGVLEKMTPETLREAARYGSLDVVKHLLTVSAVLENVSASWREELLEKVADNGCTLVLEFFLKIQAFQEAIPLSKNFLVRIIQKRQIKIIDLLLRSPKFWSKSLLCLKKKTELTLKDKEILKTCLQVALLKKIAEFKIYPDDQDFVKKAKIHSSRILDKALPNEILKEITQFTSSFRYFCPLPPKIALDLYPKILEYLGFDLPNKALKYRGEYYLDPSFKQVPILRAYQAIDRLRNSRLTSNFSKPLSLPSASASSVCAPLQTDAMDIDAASSVVLNIEASKKRKRTTPEKKFNTSAAALMMPENEIAVGVAEPILGEEREPKRAQFRNK